jgi:putative sigma-54 modulation protein
MRLRIAQDGCGSPLARLRRVEKENTMQLTVTGHQLDVTPALRDYVEKKLDRVARHFDKVIDVHCVLTVEKLGHRAEATLKVSGGNLHAEATQENMYAAIDVLADKLDRQVNKYKEKKGDHHAAEAPRGRVV